MRCKAAVKKTNQITLLLRSSSAQIVQIS